jgi:DNA polymerase-4
VSKRLSGHGIHTVRELADADEAVLVGEFGPRMGVWYSQLGRGIGSAVVDDSPWIARGHSRETTYQRNLTTPDEVRAAVRELASQVFDDTVKEGRPVFRVTLKVRYAPFFTSTKARKLAAPTSERADVVEAAVALAETLDAEREVRLLGVRAEMVMPDEGDPVERTPVRGRL